MLITFLIYMDGKADYPNEEHYNHKFKKFGRNWVNCWWQYFPGATLKTLIRPFLRLNFVIPKKVVDINLFGSA